MLKEVKWEPKKRIDYKNTDTSMSKRVFNLHIPHIDYENICSLEETTLYGMCLCVL